MRAWPAGRFSDQLILWDNGPSGTEGAMKKTRFSEEQMVKILREADKASVSEVAKKHGVSEVTIYACSKRFGQLEAADVKRRNAHCSGDPSRSRNPVISCQQSVELYRRIGYQPPWVSYIATDGNTGVGGGAFVGAPRDGVVEIAYFTLPEFMGRGYATLTARHLVGIAR